MVAGGRRRRAKFYCPKARRVPSTGTLVYSFGRHLRVLNKAEGEDREVNAAEVQIAGTERPPFVWGVRIEGT
jgi:hypothetical protein